MSSDQADPCDLVLGLDEAGRGPLLGPMVLAAVALSPSVARRLRRAGVADSKTFGAGEKAHARRRALVDLILHAATFVDYEICTPSEIDSYVARNALNVLERERATALFARAPRCRRIVCDGENLFSPLRDSFPHLEARDGGEDVHVAVAAASLCAKVRRDDLFAAIAARYADEFGPLRGLGYCNPGTRAFVRAYVRRYGSLPPEARASWDWQGGPPRGIVRATGS